MKLAIGTIVMMLSAAVVAGSSQSREPTAMTTVRVRYMVKAVEPAIEFYTQFLGFRLKQENKPYFAMVSKGNLELVLSTPFGPGGAAKPMPDGRKPEAGGWNRIIINVDDLQGEVARLQKAHLQSGTRL